MPDLLRDEAEYLHADLTKSIIGSFYNVYNALGYGFLERVYERALCIELTQSGLSVCCQHPINVYYKNNLIGEYFADMIVNDTVIIELKANESIAYENELQLINYLKATNIEVGLLLNFGRTAEIRRKAFSNHRKQLA